MMMTRTIKDDKLKIGDYFYIDEEKLSLSLDKRKSKAYLLIKVSYMDTVHIKFGIFDNKYGKDIYKVINITEYEIEDIFMENL